MSTTGTQKSPYQPRVVGSNPAKRIAPVHLRAARAWIDYTTATASFAFSVHGRQAKADETAKLATKVLAIIRGSPGISRTDISNALGRHESSKDIGAALQELLARRDRSPPARRPWPL
jgi:hypothetical protein